MADALHQSRWTVNAGSNARSRAAVVIVSGDHEWQASAEGNGAIDALYKAVDQAVAGVLSGNPRLLAFDIHALGEGSDTVGEVKVRIAPPEREGARGSGEYLGQARGDSIVAASIEAYLQANTNDPRPFVWTATAEEILEKVSRGRVARASIPANNETPHQRSSGWV